MRKFFWTNLEFSKKSKIKFFTENKKEESKLYKSKLPSEFSGNKLLKCCILPKNLEEKNIKTQKEILGLFPLKHWADKFNFDCLISSQKLVLLNRREEEEKKKPLSFADQKSQNIPIENCRRNEDQNKANLFHLSANYNIHPYYVMENCKLTIDRRHHLKFTDINLSDNLSK